MKLVTKLKRGFAFIVVIAGTFYIHKYFEANLYKESEILILHLATALFITIVTILAIFKIFGGGTSLIRGTKLISYNKAKSIANKKVKGDEYIYFGHLALPMSLGTSHFAAVGATKSGKTVTLRLLMQSVLPLIGRGKNKRALLYDAKQDLMPLLTKLCRGVKIANLNAFDNRSVGWAISKDVRSPAECQQIASALIPESKSESQPYFSDTARHLLDGVLIAFNIHAPGKWTFRDVMVAIRNMDNVYNILASCRETENRLQHFDQDEAIRNVKSTFTTKMQAYEFIAAAWDNAKELVSIEDWINDEYVLVLGNSPTSSKAIDELNRVFLRRVVEVILEEPETTDKQTWIFLDEVRQAGKLDSLNLLLTKGRSKGACVVLGFQDIDGMRDVYGKEVANELVGQCNNKAILKINSPETAEWASRLFGDYETFEERRSKNHSNTSLINGSTSISHQRVSKSVVMKGEVLNLPDTGDKRGISAFYIIPSVGSYFKHVKHKWLKRYLVNPESKVQGFEKRPSHHQSIRFWDKEDLDRLGLTNIIKLDSESPIEDRILELEKNNDKEKKVLNEKLFRRAV